MTFDKPLEVTPSESEQLVVLGVSTVTAFELVPVNETEMDLRLVTPKGIVLVRIVKSNVDEIVSINKGTAFVAVKELLKKTL